MSENDDVRDPMVGYAGEIGWQVVTQQDALSFRGGETGILFGDILTHMLLALNPGVVDPPRAQEIIRQLNLLPANIRGNCDALRWMRGENSVFVPEVICPPFSGQCDGSGFGQRSRFMDGCTTRTATADGDTSGLPPRVAAGTALISGLHRPIM